MNSMPRQLVAMVLRSIAAAAPLALAALPAHAADVRFAVAEYSSKTGPFFEDVAKDYEKLHPDVHINIEVVSWDSLLQRLTTDVAANSPPDLSIIGTRWLYDFTSQDVVEPLDKYMTP
jgi:multiple sugar transport system substrate-binding protein